MIQLGMLPETSYYGILNRPDVRTLRCRLKKLYKEKDPEAQTAEDEYLKLVNDLCVMAGLEPYFVVGPAYRRRKDQKEAKENEMPNL